jgi:hypothetical protein
VIVSSWLVPECEPVRLAGGGSHVFASRADKQTGLLRRERPAVPVHEPLAGASAHHVKAGKQRTTSGRAVMAGSFRQAVCGRRGTHWWLVLVMWQELITAVLTVSRGPLTSRSARCAGQGRRAG